MSRVDRGRKAENGSVRWMGLWRQRSSTHYLLCTRGNFEPQLQNGPLTSTLSPSEGERENHRQRLGKSGAPGVFERRRVLLPLPKGEGRGEGEQGARFSRLLDVTISLWHLATSWGSQ